MGSQFVVNAICNLCKDRWHLSHGVPCGTTRSTAAREQVMRRVRQTGIRLPEELILKLKREAARRRVSFNDEVRMRLQDSLENRDAPRAFDAIQEDMRIAWERYVNRLI